MASITYNIKSKHDNKGINDAVKGINNISSAVGKLNQLAQGFIAIKAVQALGKVINASMDAFKTQQTAIATLTQAVDNNSKLASGSLQRLIQYSSQLQKTSIYGDEELQKQSAYLASLQLTESQIKAVLDASVGMASSGLMPLDAAVKNIAKTFGGMAGELGEKIPELRTLTAEQLRAGEAVALLQKNFGGYATTAVNTLAGAEAQVRNLTGDIKEKIGAVFGELKLKALEGIKPFLEKFNEGLETAKNKIVNMIRYFPEVAPLLLDLFKKIGSNLLNPQYLFSVVVELGKHLWRMVTIFSENILPIIGNIFKHIINWILYLHYRGAKIIDWIGAALKDAFLSVAESFINTIIDGINKALEFVNKIPGVDIKSITKVDFNTDSRKAVAESTADYDTWRNADWSNALAINNVNVGEKITNFFSDSIDSMGTLLDGIFTPLTDGTEGTLSQINEILNRQVEATDKVAGAVTDLTGNDENKEPGYKDADYYNNLPEAKRTEQDDEFSSNLINGILEAEKERNKAEPTIFQKLLSGFAPLLGMVQSLGAIQKLLNPMQVILDGIMSVLEPIVNSLLRPLIGIFRIVGEVIGKMIAPILLQLSPIIELLAKAFVILYNYAIMPFANSIIWLTTTLYNGIAYFVNGIMSFIDGILPGKQDWRMGTLDYNSLKLQAISTSSLDSAGESAGVGYSSGSSGSASYSGASNITNNMYITIENLNGTDEEAAIKLYNMTQSLILKGVLA